MNRNKTRGEKENDNGQMWSSSIPSGAKPAWKCIVELLTYTIALILMIGVITVVCGVIGKT